MVLGLHRIYYIKGIGKIVLGKYEADHLFLVGRKKSGPTEDRTQDLCVISTAL